MKIIKKYYDKLWRLRMLKNKKKEPESTVRFKVLKTGKEFPCCDFHGKCTNKAYAEVFPIAKKEEDKGWSYLCKRHYYQEQKRLKWKLPACLSVQW